MKKVIAIAVAVTSLMAYQAANATVTINISAGDLTGPDASTLVPSGALAILVADTTGTAAPNNLAPSSLLSTGSVLTLTSAGDTYQILGAWNSSSGSSQAGLLSDSTGGIAGTTAGNQLYLLWFPGLTLSSTTVGSGTQYGEYGGTTETSGELAGNGPSDAWLMPAQGGLINIAALTSSEGGDTPNSELAATLTTVPEPSSIALVLIGLFGAVGLVRRRRS